MRTYRRRDRVPADDEPDQLGTRRLGRSYPATLLRGSLVLIGAKENTSSRLKRGDSPREEHEPL